MIDPLPFILFCHIGWLVGFQYKGRGSVLSRWVVVTPIRSLRKVERCEECPKTRCQWEQERGRETKNNGQELKTEPKTWRSNLKEYDFWIRRDSLRGTNKRRESWYVNKRPLSGRERPHGGSEVSLLVYSSGGYTPLDSFKNTSSYYVTITPIVRQSRGPRFTLTFWMTRNILSDSSGLKNNRRNPLYQVPSSLVLPLSYLEPYHLPCIWTSSLRRPSLMVKV